MIEKKLKGSCDCGGVQFEVTGLREGITVCHCSQCRRLSGHQWAATHAAYSDVNFTQQSGLKWYRSSDWASRGFCGECGASLFYRMNDEAGVGIAPGCLEAHPALYVEKHIFVKDKADYYHIGDNAPQISDY
ncbi:MAG: GFA family protein [Pseudomonadales bacterium]